MVHDGFDRLVEMSDLSFTITFIGRAQVLLWYACRVLYHVATYDSQTADHIWTGQHKFLWSVWYLQTASQSTVTRLGGEAFFPLDLFFPLRLLDLQYRFPFVISWWTPQSRSGWSALYLNAWMSFQNPRPRAFLLSGAWSYSSTCEVRSEQLYRFPCLH